MTKNAKKLLDFLRKYIEKNKISPNYEEMKEHMGLKSKSSIFQYLESVSYTHLRAHETG